jgi:hypothetical protein
MISSVKPIFEDHQEEVIYATNRQITTRLSEELSEILYLKKVQNYQKTALNLFKQIYDIGTNRKTKKQAD